MKRKARAGLFGSYFLLKLHLLAKPWRKGLPLQSLQRALLV